MKRCVTTTHLGVLGNSEGVLWKHTLFKSVQVSVFVECSFPMLLVSVKQIVVYVNTEYRSMFPRANCLEFSKGSHLFSGRQPAKKQATLSIEPPTFPGNRGWWERHSIDNCLLLHPSHLLQNLMRSLSAQTVLTARLPQYWEYVSHRRVLQRANSERLLQRSPSTFLWSSPRTGI